jgi:P27 family predicted phage terminase small subunit
MGRRGPSPTSTRLKILAGNAGKRPLKTRRAEVPSSRVDCPQWLTAAAKEEWRRLAPQLTRRGLLTPLDRAAFATYCQAFGRWRDCLAAIESLGTVYVTAGGRVHERPEVKMAHQYSQLMRAFAVEFGMTPGSRTRMSIPDAPDPNECPRCGLPRDWCGCSV